MIEAEISFTLSSDLSVSSKGSILNSCQVNSSFIILVHCCVLPLNQNILCGINHYMFL